MFMVLSAACQAALPPSGWLQHRRSAESADMAELLSTHMLACGVLWLAARAMGMIISHHATVLQAVRCLLLGDVLSRGGCWAPCLVLTLRRVLGASVPSPTLTAVETFAWSSADH